MLISITLDFDTKSTQLLTHSLSHRIKCPIKLVWGDQDPFTPLDGPYGKFFQGLALSRDDVSRFLSLEHNT